MATKVRSWGGVMRVRPVFEWGEPDGCTTPRGWCCWSETTHPDYDPDRYGWECFVHYGSGLSCGNYLDYTGTNEPGRDGKRVHAVAFCKSLGPVSTSEYRLGHDWFGTIAEAKEWIEGQLRAYVGLPRDGSDPPTDWED